jgi:hypothetical protein
MFKGVNGQPIQGIELFAAWIVLIGLTAFAAYIWVYAPYITRKKNAEREEQKRQERELDELRRSRLKPEELRLEDENNLKRRVDEILEARETKRKEKEAEAKADHERAESNLVEMYGLISPKLVCQHCQEKGQVRSKSGTRQTTSSGGFIADTVTGAKRTTSQKVTKFYCGNCGIGWSVEK